MPLLFCGFSIRRVKRNGPPPRRRLRGWVMLVVLLVVAAPAAALADAGSERGFGLKDPDFHIQLDCLDEQEDIAWRALNCPFPRTSYKLLSDANINEWGEALATAAGGLIWGLYTALAGLVFAVLWNALTMPWVNWFVLVADRLSTAVVRLVLEFWWAAILAVGVVAALRFLNLSDRGGQQPGRNLAKGFKFLLGAVLWLGLFTAAANWHGANPFEPDATADECAEHHLNPDPREGCVNGLTRAALLPIVTMLRIAAGFDHWAGEAVDYVTGNDTSTAYGEAGVWAPYIWGPSTDAAGELEEAFELMTDSDRNMRRLQPAGFQPGSYTTGADGGAAGGLSPCLTDSDPPQDTPGGGTPAGVSLVDRASLMEPLACRVLQPWKKYLLHNVWETFHWGQAFNPDLGDLVTVGQDGHEPDTYPDGLDLSNGQTVALLLWGSSNPNGRADSELMHNLQIDGQLVAPSDNGQHFTGDVLLNMLAVGPGLIAGLMLLGLMMYASFHILIVIGLIPAVWVAAPVPAVRRMTVRMGLSLLRSGILVAGTLLFVNIMLIYQDVLFSVAEVLPGVLAALVAVAGQVFLLVVPFKLFTVSKRANRRFKARLEDAKFTSLQGLKTLGKGLGQDVRVAGREAFGAGLKRVEPAHGSGAARTITGKQPGPSEGRRVFTGKQPRRSDDPPTVAEPAEPGRKPATAAAAAAAVKTVAGRTGVAASSRLADTKTAKPVSLPGGPPKRALPDATGRIPRRSTPPEPAGKGIVVAHPPTPDPGGRPLSTISGKDQPADRATSAPTPTPGKPDPGSRSLSTISGKDQPADRATSAPTVDADPAAPFPKPGRVTRAKQAAKEIAAAGAKKGVQELAGRTELGKSVVEQAEKAKQATAAGRRFVAAARREGIPAAVKPPTGEQQKLIDSINGGKMGTVGLVELVTGGKGGPATEALEQQQALQKQQQGKIEQLRKTQQQRNDLRRRIGDSHRQAMTLMLDYQNAADRAKLARQERDRLAEQPPEGMSATDEIKQRMNLRKAEQKLIAAQQTADDAYAKWEQVPETVKEQAGTYQQTEQRIEQHEQELAGLERNLQETIAGQNRTRPRRNNPQPKTVRRQAARRLLLNVPTDRLGIADRQLLSEKHRNELQETAAALNSEDQQKAAELGWSRLLRPADPT